MRLLTPVFHGLFCCSAALFLLGVPVFGGSVYCLTTLGALGSGSAQPTAFNSAGAEPPARKASYASRRQGKRWKSGRSKRSCANAVKSSGATPEAMRSG